VRRQYLNPRERKLCKRIENIAYDWLHSWHSSSVIVGVIIIIVIIIIFINCNWVVTLWQWLFYM